MTPTAKQQSKNLNFNPNPKFARQRRYARTEKGKAAANKARMNRYVAMSQAKVVCLCGSSYNAYHRARHIRTQRHQTAMEKARANL